MDETKEDNQSWLINHSTKLNSAKKVQSTNSVYFSMQYLTQFFMCWIGTKLTSDFLFVHELPFQTVFYFSLSQDIHFQFSCNKIETFTNLANPKLINLARKKT